MAPWWAIPAQSFVGSRDDRHISDSRTVQFLLTVGHLGVTFPEDVTAPTQYGPRIEAFVLYLQNHQLLPEKRLAMLMADLFGVNLTTATIARISQDYAARCQSFVDTLREQVAKARVKHMDETGFRVGGKTQWLHIASTILLTFYRVSSKRGSLMQSVSGIVAHDHWKPYYTLSGVLHAQCNAQSPA
jgi:transposase